MKQVLFFCVLFICGAAHAQSLYSIPTNYDVCLKNFNGGSCQGAPAGQGGSGNVSSALTADAASIATINSTLAGYSTSFATGTLSFTSLTGTPLINVAQITSNSFPTATSIGGNGGVIDTIMTAVISAASLAGTACQISTCTFIGSPFSQTPCTATLGLALCTYADVIGLIPQYVLPTIGVISGVTPTVKGTPYYDTTTNTMFDTYYRNGSYSWFQRAFFGAVIPAGDLLVGNATGAGNYIALTSKIPISSGSTGGAIGTCTFAQGSLSGMSVTAAVANSLTFTPSAVSGTYTQFCNRIDIEFSVAGTLEYTGTAPTGSLQITGLPTNKLNNGINTPIQFNSATVSFTYPGTGATSVQMEIPSNQNYLIITSAKNGGTRPTLQIGGIVAAVSTPYAVTFSGAGTYFVSGN